MADSDESPSARGDEGELFREFNDKLMRSLAREARPEVVEEACAFAWAQFLEHQPNRELNWQGWLYRTAQRQAWVLERQADGADVTAEVDVDGVVAHDPMLVVDEVEIRQDVREALELISQLSPRLQRIAMLRALGFKYREIGAVTGDSNRRVHQLVGKANEQIHELLAERAHAAEPHASRRAERLWELENDPPKWLVDKIGHAARPNRRVAGQAIRRRAWLRAALALDDYRSAAGPELFDAMTHGRPDDPALRKPHAAAIAALDELERERDKRRGLSREL